jgi:hypothetical protein
MTTAAEIQRGQRVKILGRHQQRRVTVFLTRTPLSTQDGTGYIVQGFSARNGRHGTSSVNVVRIVDADEVVEVVE